MCCDGRERGGAARAATGRDAGRRRRPGRWRGTSRGTGVPGPGLPMGRYVEPLCRPGAKGPPSGPRLGRERENKDLGPSVRRQGNGEASVSPLGVYGAGGSRLGGGWWAGGCPPAWRTKSRAWGRPPLPPTPDRGLFPAASQEGCRKHFPKSSLGGRNPLLFCSRKGKSGPEVPVAMLWPSSSPA